VEIYRDFEANEINQAAADWLLRDGNLTEPWVYLIGPDGTIVDRWATLFREEEVAAALDALPRMKQA
jgi:peroxiredoxin